MATRFVNVPLSNSGTNGHTFYHDHSYSYESWMNNNGTNYSEQV